MVHVHNGVCSKAFLIVGTKCSAANLSLSKKVLLRLKNHILRWKKKENLRAERASRARSPFGRGPGTLRALEAHGF